MLQLFENILINANQNTLISRATFDTMGKMPRIVKCPGAVHCFIFNFKNKTSVESQKGVIAWLNLNEQDSKFMQTARPDNHDKFCTWCIHAFNNYLQNIEEEDLGIIWGKPMDISLLK